ncbi:hypothetical protein [Crocosphaera chwakensis]|uniref:Uncharacterized protein n=1 Tax=Crocosphaera chwakensis CCY0110 TaxID=391612 RepID=A3IJT9_9CHRO|nr:hypothetical protein [Crocosphaera chwakensis]EAZ94071.1 hypothetical protein CY0110_19787 [Crocosphaera chwakensis CCY0110]
MESPKKKRRRTLARKVDDEVEKIIYKVMTNEGLEQTIARAVIKGLIALIRRYFFLAVVSILLLLILQSILISLSLKFILGLN